MTFYMTETPIANVYKQRIDVVINSKTLKSAKSVATRKQFFKDTVINLYLDNRQKNLVSRKINGVWCDRR